MRELDIASAPQRDARHWSRGTTTWEGLAEMAASPASVKDCGNYLLGRLRKTTVDHDDHPSCTRYHRNKRAIEVRSALTLDADSPRPDLPDRLALLTPWAAIIHTTYSSAPDAPRYRVILPLSRDVLPDEYHQLASVVLDRLGREQFDPGSVEPERYMFRPSAQSPDWYRHWVVDGEPLDVDELLADWQPDLSNQPIPAKNRNKRDPFDLPGAAGAFNRAYPTLAEVVAAYDLPYVSVDDARWTLAGVRSVAGVNEVAPGLYYSHHVTDPAYGQTCSPFDLVRLHRFGHLDEDIKPNTPVNMRPSHAAMLELAATDPRVIAKMVGSDFDAEMDDLAAEVEDEGWETRIRFNAKTGKMVDVVENWDLIVRHEPVFDLLYFNEFTLSVEAGADLPWRPLSKGGPTFSTVDRTELREHLERKFRLRPNKDHLDARINATAHRHYVNPVRDYLEALEWDGVERVETALPGVVPTPYTRMAARKALVAAVARALDPGCKWDHTLVLYGLEGLGKSWWVDRMARGYSATLGKIGDKDTLLAMQRSWIMVSDEGYSLRKVDADMHKEFLTRTEDVFRMPYDRETLPHPRHCVIWGTTNDEVFLRRQQGNRRFLIVRCTERFDFDSLTPEYVDQVWAEAVTLYRAGERLFLTEEESVLATTEREDFTEEDPIYGLVEQYLETLVPPTWDEMSPEARKQWLAAHADGLVADGTVAMDRVCSTQVWVEGLNHRFGAQNRNELLAVNTVLKAMSGWRALSGRHRVPHYGSQLVFVRE